MPLERGLSKQLCVQLKTFKENVNKIIKSSSLWLYILTTSSSSPRPSRLLKGLLVFTWVWCLHLLSPSPDTACFYYNSIIPLVLIKYCVCVGSHPFIKNEYSGISARSYLCCCFSPSLPFGHAFSPIFSAHVVCVCVWDIHGHQMHFSGSAAITVSVTIFATPGNYYAKITAHSISIKCVRATVRCHHVALCYQRYQHEHVA